MCAAFSIRRPPVLEPKPCCCSVWQRIAKPAWMKWPCHWYGSSLAWADRTFCAWGAAIRTSISATAVTSFIAARRTFRRSATCAWRAAATGSISQSLTNHSFFRLMPPRVSASKTRVSPGSATFSISITPAFRPIRGRPRWCQRGIFKALNGLASSSRHRIRTSVCFRKESTVATARCIVLTTAGSAGLRSGTANLPT